MDGFIAFSEPFARIGGPITMLMGALVVWHGLRGRPSTKRGLLRSKAGTLYRSEGWRRVVTGLVIVGLGTALFQDSALLLVLSLGIGFVELWEASFVISVMRQDEQRCSSRRQTVRPRH